ncbi:MAG: hypothetical protein HY791_35315 [Deltaproteobacteria bacterium]|nr:hypothetical protein [Deltaproteobacteria bacterium]
MGLVHLERRSVGARLLAPISLAPMIAAACVAADAGAPPQATPAERAKLLDELGVPELELKVAEIKGSSSAAPTVRPLGTRETAALEQLLLKPIERTSAPPLPTRSDAPPSTSSLRALEPTKPPPPSAGPLRVAHFSPHADAAEFRQLAITFSEPMVGLGGGPAPATLTPEIPGEGRWIGEATWVFDLDSASEDGSWSPPSIPDLRVTVPAGLHSLAGQRLTETWLKDISSPPPRLLAAWPSKKGLSSGEIWIPAAGPQPAEPVIALLFDRRVDPVEIARQVELRWKGSRPRKVALMPCELADEEETYRDSANAGSRRTVRPTDFAGNPYVFRALGQYPASRRVLLRPASPLPTQTKIEVELAAKGPRSRITFGFDTFGPLRVLRATVDRNVTVQFSNPLAENLNLSGVRLGESVTLSTVSASQDFVRIDIDSPLELEGLRRLPVTLPGSIRDVFGNELGRARTIQADVEPPDLRGARIRLFDASGSKHFELPLRHPATLHFRQVVIEDLRRLFSPPTRSKGIPKVGRFLRSLEVEPSNGAAAIDLSRVLGQPTGHILLDVEVRGRVERRLWIQATRLSMFASFGDRRVDVFVTHLAGTPVPGASVTAISEGKVVGGPIVSNEDGLATLHVGDTAPSLFVAELGADSMFVGQPASEPGWVDNRDVFIALFDPRGMVRSGEVAHFAGWARRIAKEGLVPLEAADELDYEVVADESPLGSGPLSLDSSGGFTFAVRVPDGLAASEVRSVVTARKNGKELGSQSHRVAVEPLRPPDVQLQVSGPADPIVAGSSVDFISSGRYYSGGPASSAKMGWQLGWVPAEYEPPGQPRFLFGRSVPWEFQHFDPKRSFEPNQTVALQVMSLGPRLEGITDADGAHGVRVSVPQGRAPIDLRLIARATLLDLSGQARVADQSVIVLPSAVAVGLRSGVASSHSTLDVQALVVDSRSGRPVPGRRVMLSLSARRWRADRYFLDLISSGEVVSDEQPTQVRLATKDPGDHFLVARTDDEAGRATETWTRLFVTNPSPTAETRPGLNLRANSAEYRVGQVAELTLAHPSGAREAWITVRNPALDSTRSLRLQLSDSPVRAKLQLLPSDLRGVVLRASVTGRWPDGSPMVLWDQERIIVKPGPAETLIVEVTPSTSRAAPGDQTTVRVRAQTETHAVPDGMRAIVSVVDAGVLELANWQPPDPPSDLFRGHYPYQSDWSTSDWLSDREVVSYASESGREPKAPGALRSEFEPTVFFRGSIPLNAEGAAEVPLSLGHALTRYRVTAIVADSRDAFGHGFADITTELPLSVRVSPPRFVRASDEFLLPIVVESSSGVAHRASVVARSRALGMLQAFAVDLPAHGRALIEVPGRASSEPTALIEAAAKRDTPGPAGPDVRDAIELQLPIQPDSLVERAGLSGRVPDEYPVRVRITPPPEAQPGKASLDVQISSSATGDFGAFASSATSQDLAPSIFDNTEQRASKLLAWVATATVPRARVEAALNQLMAAASPAGFASWPVEQAEYAEMATYPTLHATHALLRARARGFVVADRFMDRLLNSARAFARKEHPVLRAYALYVLALASPTPSADLQRTLPTDTPVEALSFLFSARAHASSRAELRSLLLRLRGAVELTATYAQLRVPDYGTDAGYVYPSRLRASALFLEGLCLLGREPDLARTLAAGIVAERVGSSWWTHSDTAFALLALEAYRRRFETSPADRADVWLGKSLGSTLDLSNPRSITASLRELDPPELTLQGRGAYFSLGLEYELGPRAPATSRGFFVGRSYAAVDQPHDVRVEGDEYVIRAGSLVRVLLSLATPSSRYHVILTDSLPAGLEPLVGADFKPRRLPYGQRPVNEWADRAVMGDDGIRLFATRLPEGAYSHSYFVRATVRGRYAVPGARAEETYSPETFGRSAAHFVRIE